MRDRVTFIHTADVHLDAPFEGIGAASEKVGRALAEATYEAFSRVVDTALARAVDFVVIAGDAYNARDKSLRAQLRFRDQMARLAEADIEVFVAQGNHDPASGWSAGLVLPSNVHFFSAEHVERFEVVRDGESVAAVYGRSFARAAESSNLALGYRRAPGDAIAIGVLHANVGGNRDYDAYAPANLDDLRTSGMDYWALGHIHKQAILSQNPWVVYSGSPQGLNPKETGPHGCFVVEIAAGGSVTLTHVETAPIAWAQVALDASSCDGIDDLMSALETECERLRADEQRHVVVRVALVGRSPAHGDLVRAGVIEALFEELRSQQASRGPWVWIDRLSDRTAAPLDLDALRSGADFASEVMRIADELAADSAATAVLCDEIASPVATSLPGGYVPGVGAADAVERARNAVLDELLGGDLR